MITVGSVTETIYKSVFGKTEAELIVESKGHWQSGSIAMHDGDVHEIMCDLMTTEAITALNKATVISSLYLLNSATFDTAWLSTLEQHLTPCRFYGKLWEWE